MRYQKVRTRRKSLMIELDPIDRRILDAHVANGRMTTLEVADRVGLSPTPCSRRIRRLEAAGVIQGYSAQINRAALGLSISVVVSVRLSRQGPDGHGQFMSAISNRPEVAECLLVTGNIDYLLRIWVRDMDDLRQFIIDVLQSIPVVAETSTMVVVN
jgi:Lrp/AsnC family leucine-responsive transcriptional regulator